MIWDGRQWIKANAVSGSRSGVTFWPARALSHWLHPGVPTPFLHSNLWIYPPHSAEGKLKLLSFLKRAFDPGTQGFEA